MRWLVLLLAVLQIVTAWLPSGVGVGENIAARSAPVATPATPAGYAFAIWGLIYLWCLAFAIWQAMPARRRHGLCAAVRGPAALLFAANAAWSLYVQLFAIDAISLAIIMVGLVAGLAAMRALARLSPPPFSAPGLLAGAPLSLTAGWVCVAAFANIAAVLAYYRLDPGHLGSAGQAAMLVLAAGLVAAWVTRATCANLAFPAAALWGLGAIAIANQPPEGGRMVMFAAIVAAMAVLLAALLARRARRTGLAAP